MIDIKDDITLDKMIKLDEEINFIPLTYDKIFKGIFKDKLEILKMFILDQLELDINPDDCKIELFDSEIPKISRYEYQKTVDIYVKIENIFVNIEINREYFRNVWKRNLLYADRLYSMTLNEGENLGNLEFKYFVQININAMDKLDINKEKFTYGTDKLVTYGINSKTTYNDNKLIIVKYLEYYRDLYYNKGEKLKKIDLWMVLLTSRTFQEVYNVSKKLFDKELHYEFMRKVMDMIGDRRYFEDWEIEQLNAYVDYKKEQNAIKDGLEIGYAEGYDKGIREGFDDGLGQGIEKGMEKGIEQNIKKTIKNLLEAGMDLEFISKITGKQVDEIEKIKDTLV